jgi:hypothetical protein
MRHSNRIVFCLNIHLYMYPQINRIVSTYWSLKLVIRKWFVFQRSAVLVRAHVTLYVTSSHNIVARIETIWDGYWIDNWIYCVQLRLHLITVYTLYNSQFTIHVPSLLTCVFTGFLSSNTVGPVHLQNQLPLLPWLPRTRPPYCLRRDTILLRGCLATVVNKRHIAYSMYTSPPVVLIRSVVA